MDLDCISIPPQRPTLGVADIGRTTLVELAKRKQDWDLFPSYWILLESEVIHCTYGPLSQSETPLVPSECRCKHAEVRNCVGNTCRRVQNITQSVCCQCMKDK